MPKKPIRNRKVRNTAAGASPMLAMTMAGLPTGLDPANAKGAQPASGPGGGASAQDLVRRSNMWRDNYNPLRALTIARLLALFEQAERGAYSEIQLTLRKAEKRFPVLKGFIEKLLSSVEELDGKVRIKEELPDGATPEMAENQRKFLQQRYDLLKNFKTSIAQIALADVRGYAVLQKHRYQDGANEGAVEELYWIEPWCWVRDGFYGDFYYNENSQFGIGLGSCAATLGEKNRIGSGAMPREDFVIRESESPLYEIALIAFVNWLMGRKDHAAYVEIFGIPKGVVIMPPNIPPASVGAFEMAAQEVSEGMAGSLPNGSTIIFPTQGMRGEAPFETYCQVQEKDVCLAGTGGQLTMLAAQHGGIGKGGAEEHDDAWQQIAVTKAVRINDALQKDFDAPELAAEFPGEPVCVFFAFGLRDEKDAGEICDAAGKLALSGLEPDLDWLNQATGYKFVKAAVPPPGNPPEPGEIPEEPAPIPAKDEKVANRAPVPGVPDPQKKKFLTAAKKDLQPFLMAFGKRLENIVSISDPALRRQKFDAAWDELAPLRADIHKDPASAHVLAQINTMALAGGLITGGTK